MAPEVHAAGVEWWNERFSDAHDDRVCFSTVFLPALLKSCRLEIPASDALSIEELRVVAKYAVADSAWQHDTISLTDFLHFLARFGPLQSCLQRLIDSLTMRRELVTWFHGTITRSEAEKVLLTSSSSSSSLQLSDGAFLVRFSESQPTRFTLSYLKIHTSGPHVGKKEVRNVLIENNGKTGFVLCDSRTKAYPSIRDFIARSTSRLKHGIASSFAARCNLELAAVRARQDLASNSYSSFSTESLEPSSSTTSSPVLRPQRPLASLLFSKSPDGSPPPTPLPRGNQEEEEEMQQQSIRNDNYSGFAMESLLVPPLTLKTTTTTRTTITTSNNNSSNGYGAFSAAAMVASMERPSPPHSPPRGHQQIPFITPPEGADYGDFASFTSAITSFHRVAPPSPSSPSCRTSTSNNDDEYASFEAFQPTPRSQQQHQSATALFTTTTTTSSFVASALAMASTSTSSDTYGSFEAFDWQNDAPSSVADAACGAGQVPELKVNASVVSPPPPPPVMVVDQDGDDAYGSFAAFSTEFCYDSPVPSLTIKVPLLPPLPPTAPAAQPSPHQTPVTTSGSASHSLFVPTQAPIDAPAAFSTVASSSSQSDESFRPAPRPVGSRPIQVSSDDAYGSFESIMGNETPAAVAVTVEAAQAPRSAPADMQASLSHVVDSLVPSSNSDSATVSALHELNAGMEFYKQKLLDDALLRFIHARELAQDCKDLVVEARALGNLGTVYLDKLNPQQAVACYEQCLRITRSIKDLKRERTILNNLVLALMAAEDFDSAYAYCQIQLETTLSDVNRRKILSRMSLLRERAARASKEARTAAAVAATRT